MTKNLSHRQRTIRVLASITLTVVALFGSYSMTFVLLLYGVAFLVLMTALTAYCPAHHARAVLHGRISRTPPL